MQENDLAIKTYQGVVKALGQDHHPDPVGTALAAATQLLAVGIQMDELTDLARRFSQEYAQHGTKRIDRGTIATKHRLTTGLADILINIARTVEAKDRNDIHVNREVPEICGPQAYEMLSNITKLRFHGLVAKVKDEDGKHKKGHWLITRRGGQFLRGEISLPAFAHTLDNRVVEHSGDLVDIKTLRREPRAFEQREDITYAPAPTTPGEQAPLL